MKDKYFGDRNNRNELTACITLIRDTWNQATIKIEQTGTYFVPRCGTNFLIPILNHENLRWFTVDLNNRKHSGTAVYSEYLTRALDEVIFIPFLIKINF